MFYIFGEGIYIIRGEVYVIIKCELKKKFYLCINLVNVLEVICFYVFFVCIFVFVERELVEGSSKLICFISCDENLYLSVM